MNKKGNSMKIAAWITIVAILIAVILLVVLCFTSEIEWGFVLKIIIIAPISGAWAVRTLRREKQKEKELRMGNINPGQTEY